MTTWKSAIVLQLFFAVVAMGQASINESTPHHMWYVDAGAGKDTNPGTDAEPFKTIQRALKDATTQPSKILIHSGVYREYLDIAPGEALLILEATHPGEVSISGADAVNDWQKIENGLLFFPWKNHWRLNGEQAYFPGARTRYNLRREMVFANDFRLTQRCNEDPTGSGIAPSELKPGEFTVRENEEKIYLRLPDGMPPAFGKGGRIEVAVRGYAPGKSPDDGKPLCFVRGRSNLILRGLRFERSCNYIGGNPALSIRSEGTKDTATWAGNILIDRCAFDDNNGCGFGMTLVKNLTFLNCTASRNGERGGGGHCVQNVLIDSCHIDNNGWRYGPWLLGHDMAGLKFFDGAVEDAWFAARTTNLQIKRCGFKGNQCFSLWQDFGPTGTVIDSCLFEDSPRPAIFQEVTPGPLTVRNTIIRRCGLTDEPRAAVLVVASPDVRFEGCTIFDCGSDKLKDSTLFHLLSDTRKVSPAMENKVVRLQLENCVLQANRPNCYLFRTGSWNGADNARKDFPATLVADHNIWFCADRPAEGADIFRNGKNAFFKSTIYTDKDAWMNDYPDLSFEQWQKGGQDKNSKWQSIPLETLDKIAPPHP